MISFLENLIKQAGDLLHSYFTEDQQLLKMRASVKEAVTKYDKIIDDFIVKKIRQAYPSHSLLTEESGLIEGDPNWLWIVDSLDGTSGFASSNPLFCVCIAVMRNERLVLGSVYAPAIKEFYLAEEGNGAYLNGKRIHVSGVKNLRESYLFYCEGGEKDRTRNRAIINNVYTEVTDLRKLGSAGLETAWVAAGKGDAYFTTKIEPWDVAPGVLLLQEAGGRVSDFEGNPWKLATSDLLFSNGHLHEPILERLRKA